MAKYETKSTKKKTKKQFFLIRWFKNLGAYFASAYRELKKVSWPTGKELIKNTWITIVMVLVVTGIVYLFDMLFSFLRNLIY